MRKIDPALQARLETLIVSMGYELVGCEIQPKAGQMLFRIYIDAQKGVTLDQCSEVSYQVSAMLDVDSPFTGRYVLEVSSPGIDRPLFELKHFEKVVGNRVKIKLMVPINQRRQYTGILQRVEGESLYLLPDDGEAIELPYSSVDKANVVSDIFVRKNDKGRRKKDTN